MLYYCLVISLGKIKKKWFYINNFKVRYQGQKLDVFKNKYFKMKAMEIEGKDNENNSEGKKLLVEWNLVK